MTALAVQEEEQEREKEDEYEPVTPQDLTIEQLKYYDGTEGKPILVSVNHVVYDVTKGKNFYGPGMCFCWHVPILVDLFNRSSCCLKLVINQISIKVSSCTALISCLRRPCTLYIMTAETDAQAS